MGRSIGRLGVQREPVDLDFEYFGATIRVHPQASDTVELDFLDLGRDLDLTGLEDRDLKDLDDEQAMAAVTAMSRAVAAGYRLVKGSLQRVIHPDDWAAYWRLALDNGQRVNDLMRDLKAITAAVVEADTGFPTTPPSGSPDGPGSTPPRSGGGSSSAAAPPLSDADKALALLRGRPDLQEFVVLTEEKDQARLAEALAAPTGQTAAQKLLASRS
jgi:hypothetical protein